MNRKSYPGDVSDEEWAFVAPYLTLIKEVAPQREYPLRELFNALPPARGYPIIRAGAPWRMMPNDFPRWVGRNSFRLKRCISKPNAG